MGVLHTHLMLMVSRAYGSTPACISVADGHWLLQSHPWPGRHLPRPTNSPTSHSRGFGEALYHPSIPPFHSLGLGLVKLVCMMMLLLLLLLLLLPMPMDAFARYVFDQYILVIAPQKKAKARLLSCPAPALGASQTDAPGGEAEKTNKTRNNAVPSEVLLYYTVVRYYPYRGRWTRSSVMGRRERPAGVSPLPPLLP